MDRNQGRHLTELRRRARRPNLKSRRTRKADKRRAIRESSRS